jgi:hypothetical protein
MTTVRDVGRLPGRSAAVVLFGVALCALVAAMTLTVVAIADDAPERCCSGQGASASKPSPTSRAASSRAVGLPACLVGSWRTVDEVLMVKFYTDQPTMAFVGAGRNYEFRPDGTATERVDNAVFTASFRGRELRLVGNGTLEYTWQATDRALTYLARTGGSFTWQYFDQRGLISTAQIPPTEAMNSIYDYNCQPTRMAESNSTGYRSAWVRTAGFGVYG